jgi:hypothetical protein
VKLLRDPRYLIIAVTLAAIGAGAVLVLSVIIGGWTLGLGTHDQVALVSTALVIYTCLLTAVAAIVALLAYLAATGRPDLDIAITFNFSFPNEPVFVAQRDEEATLGWRTIERFKQSLATVTLKNASSYAAKNPGVRIELEGLGGFGEQQGWETLTFATSVGVTAIQWDGGTDSIIHGRWSRALPSLDLSDIKELVRDGTALVVTVVADGVAPVSRRFPVSILDRDEYDVYTEQRAQQLAEV